MNITPGTYRTQDDSRAVVLITEGYDETYPCLGFVFYKDRKPSSSSWSKRGCFNVIKLSHLDLVERISDSISLTQDFYPKQYRPWTEEELLKLLQFEAGLPVKYGLEIRRKSDHNQKRHIMGVGAGIGVYSTGSFDYLRDICRLYEFPNGTPCGAEV